MRTRSWIAVFVVMLALGTAACDRSSAEPDGVGTGSPTPTETSDQGPINTTKDTYRYQNAGLNVLLDFDGQGGGTMQVANKTGHDLPKPGFYILDARDGSEIGGKVLDSEPVADGKSASFDVRVTGQIELKNIGLVILLMGEDNFGAFVRQ